MPVAKVGSRWSSGELIFYEKNVSLGVIANLLTIGTTAITVGSATQDVDLKVFLGSATEYILFNVGTSTLEIGYDSEGVDVQFFGDTSGADMVWDESADELVFRSGASIDITADAVMIDFKAGDASSIDPSATAETGWINVNVDGTKRYVPFYAVS